MSKVIWETLSSVDVSAKVEKKGKLNYLSWAWAWGILMEYYPEASYVFDQNEIHSDGSVTVYVDVTIENTTRRMWLPVMDHRNNSIINPTSRMISDAKMRCLTKCIGIFGLGHRIYAGEDLLYLDSESDPQQQQKNALVDTAPRPNPQDDPEKPWFNDEELNEYRSSMVSKINAGETDGAQIVRNLRNSYKVSKTMESKIIDLDNNTET